MKNTEKGRRMKTIITTIFVVLIVAVIVGLSVIYTGAFNVATSWKDPSLMRWAMVTTRENSIERRAKGIVAPPTKGSNQIESGFRSYREMCATCHALPGEKKSPVEVGLNPEPPKLIESGEHMTAAELFWVIKNGIRMTGMPAWGVTHSDNELWDIVAFIKVMPEMSKADFSRLAKPETNDIEHGNNQSEPEDKGHGDGHG